MYPTGLRSHDTVADTCLHYTPTFVRVNQRAVIFMKNLWEGYSVSVWAASSLRTKPR